MKRVSLFFVLFVILLPVVVLANTNTAPEVEPTFSDAHEIVDYIQAGWNLGNTLDAHPHGFTTAGTNPDNWTPAMQETHWGNPITTRENILAIRDAGFNAIRIPVTFYTMIDEDFNIRQDWLDRIVQVVDYAYDAGMIVIINTHHDERWIGLGLTDSDGNLVPQYSNHPARRTYVTVEDSIQFLTAIWEQLSETFADYSQRLIFEGLNEPRTIGSPAEWGGGTAVERQNLNLLNQLFVDTVRAHGGGHNSHRFLMVPTYAAAVGVQAFDGWEMPTDPAGPDRIIVSLHAYTPWRFALDASTNEFSEWHLEGTGDQDGPGPVEWALNLSRDTFPDYPIIIGEMGALNRDNLESRVAWLTFYHTLARELEMRIFWWDNGQFDIQQVNGPDQFAIFDRRTNTFPFPELVHALTGYLPGHTTAVPITSLAIHHDGDVAANFILSLPEGIRQLEAVVNPAHTTEHYEWVSSHPDVATVDENGLVTAITQGTATIYLRVAPAIGRLSTRLEIYDSVVVTVIEEETIDVPNLKVNVGVDENQHVTVTITPENDDEIRIDEDGNIVITILNPGVTLDNVDVIVLEGWGYHIALDAEGNITLIVRPPEGYEIVLDGQGNMLIRAILAPGPDDKSEETPEENVSPPTRRPLPQTGVEVGSTLLSGILSTVSGLGLAIFTKKKKKK